MTTKLLSVILCLMALTTSCSQKTDQSTEAKQTAQNKPLEIKVVSLSRVSEWQAPEMGGSVRLTKGVAMKSIGGNISGFEAEPGYEIAVVRLSVSGGAGAGVAVGEVSVFDDKGKKYSSVVGQPPPLKQDATGEFGFAVPIGTALRKIELTKDLSADLK